MTLREYGESLEGSCWVWRIEGKIEYIQNLFPGTLKIDGIFYRSIKIIGGKDRLNTSRLFSLWLVGTNKGHVLRVKGETLKGNVSGNIFL